VTNPSYRMTTRGQTGCPTRVRCATKVQHIWATYMWGHDLLPTPCTYATQHQPSLLTRQNRNEAKVQALRLVTDRHSDVDSSPASCSRGTGLIPRSANRVSFFCCFSQSLSNFGIPFQINVISFTQRPNIRCYLTL